MGLEKDYRGVQDNVNLDPPRSQIIIIPVIEILYHVTLWPHLVHLVIIWLNCDVIWWCHNPKNDEKTYLKWTDERTKWTNVFSKCFWILFLYEHGTEQVLEYVREWNYDLWRHSNLINHKIWRCRSAARSCIRIKWLYSRRNAILKFLICALGVRLGA